MEFDLRLVQQAATALALVGARLLGLFLTLPLLSMNAWPLRLRITPVLALTLALTPTALPTPEQAAHIGWLGVAAELGLGAIAGLALRVAMLAVDFMVEALSMHAGFSFAQTVAPDVAMPSTALGQLVGMAMIALLFAGDVHLLFIERIARSLATVPFGAWPAGFTPVALLQLLTQSFALGLLMSCAGIAVYLLMNVMLGMLNRISPQLNLMSVGFSISVPLALLVLALVAGRLPLLAETLVARALAFVDAGFAGAR